MRLERRERRAVEEDRLDAVRLQFLRILVGLILPARAAVRLDPAAAAHERVRAGGVRELQMLGARGGEQRGHDLGGRVLARRRRGLEIAHERGGDRGQRAIAHMGARLAVQRRPRDVGRRAREHIGDDSLGLDDAAIAEARLARDFRAAVDEGDRSAARLKRERRGDADDSGAEDDGVDSLRGHMRASLDC